MEGQLLLPPTPTRRINKKSRKSPEIETPSRRPKKTIEEDASNPRLLVLIIASIVLGAANSVTYKKLLNRFSAVDGSHNYEFFVSQWSTLDLHCHISTEKRILFQC